MKKSQRIAFDIDKAEIDTKIITRDGHSGKIDSIDLTKPDYPISATIELDGKEIPLLFTKTGSRGGKEESDYDLFIKEEVEEDDDYDPYKATVESIADMVERYSELQSIEELKDFYNNVRVKCQDAFDYGKVCMINLDEEPADNKPKFKVGDWIVQENVGVYKVTEIWDSWYEVIDSHELHYSIGFDQESMCHLWSIKDAKPGDILFHSDTASNGIFIFKEIAQDGEVVCYCDYDSEDGFCFFEEYHTCCRADDKILYIATEKQRNFLFQKMKEAGYEWDKEKKELKQINKEIKTRLMTNQELSWWLREHPEEHREYCIEGETCVCFNYHYNFGNSNEEVDKHILIRKNGGEWIIPFINV